MRLWHKDLIAVLPRQQLVSQWRECCCIAKNLANNNTPNHILVNKILDYPIDEFIYYTNLSQDELRNRGYLISQKAINKFSQNINIYIKNNNIHYLRGYDRLKNQNIFKDWHNNNYLIQNFFNLEEKHDCGMFSHEEWMSFLDGYGEALKKEDNK